jgi:hypothetical protein
VIDSNKPIHPRNLATLLRRLTLARGAFEQVMSLCDHANSMSPAPSNDLAAAIMTGIVVTYARPFTRGDGVGPLSKKYSDFPPDTPLKHFHETMLNARNWVYAHRDNLSAPQLAGDAFSAETASHLTLSITGSGHSILVYEPQISFDQVGKFYALSQYQERRAQADVSTVVESMKRALALEVGSYRVSHIVERDS